MREDYLWSRRPEPHAGRRVAIMKAHPDVAQLVGHEWRSKYICVFALILPQLWLAHATVDLPWLPYVVVAYTVGATITQALFLAIHELAHNLFFKRPAHNRMFAVLVNLPIVVPYCAAFRGYHLEHHKFQGVDGIDTDIPTRWEAQWIAGPLTKLLWISLQILTYALRPVFVKPQTVTRHHVWNWTVQLAFDAAVWSTCGWRPLGYLAFCILLAGGWHPCAGHFISEHYVFPEQASTAQETYSYYGALNYLTWNVGYHNEHHDFPFVPWSRLPRLRATAPEFYDCLTPCTSWWGILVRYVVDPNMGPRNRVKRRHGDPT